VGSTLSQLDKNGHNHPIHFASRQLTSVEKNYIVTKLEGLIIIFSLKKFRHYLMGYKAKIFTGHKALTYLVNKPNPSGRLAQWLLSMEEFDIDIVHHPGTLQQKRGILRSKYHRKQQRKKFLKTHSCEPQFLANS